MKNIKIWFFLIIIICCIIQGLYLKEPFNYINCRNKGFSTKFCVQTPIIELGPGQCRCDNNDISEYKLGFGTQCMCN